MGVAAILVVWPKQFEQAFVPVEEKMFENVDGRQTPESLVYY